MLPNWLFVLQVMMLLHQTVEQRLVAGSSHLLQLDGLELFERSGDRRHVDEHRCGSGAPDKGVECLEADGWQFDLAGPVEHEQSATAHHIAQSAVSLFPLP